MPETRITGGRWRGRIIQTPRGMPLRPTRSMVRQALFNILGPAPEGARFVDLYAGVGSVGFEALSRGWGQVTFVEKDRHHLRLIADNAARFGCTQECQLVHADVVTWLERGGRRLVAGADVCYIDSPYRDPSLDRVLDLVGASPPPTVVCEHHRERKVTRPMEGLGPPRERAYGLTRLTIWEALEEGE